MIEHALNFKNWLLKSIESGKPLTREDGFRTFMSVYCLEINIEKTDPLKVFDNMTQAFGESIGEFMLCFNTALLSLNFELQKELKCKYFLRAVKREYRMKMGKICFKERFSVWRF